jgi:integrase
MRCGRGGRRCDSLKRVRLSQRLVPWKCSPTKTRKSRVVDLRPNTVAVLKAHKARQAESRLKAGTLWIDSGYVFTTDIGKPLDQRYIQRKLDAACEKAQIARRRVKETSHTYATLGLVHNVPVKVISEVLGHTSVVITYDIYSHVISGLQEDPMKHLDRLFS